MDLDNNQKAAFFISWFTKEECEEKWDNCRTWHLHGVVPDMTKAENWGKAIEFLISRLYKISIYEGGYDSGDPYVVSIEGWLNDTKIVEESTESLGKAFQMALSKAYDVEHKRDEEFYGPSKDI